MPTVTLNRKEVEKLMGKKLSLEQLKDRISMLGTDLEEVTDKEIIVEIFPNRPDMLSEQGFARALSSFIGVNTGLKKYNVGKAEKDYRVIVDKSVDNVRPFTACAIVKGLKLDDEKIREIIQVQEKLHVTFGRNRKKLAIGIYPLGEITLPIIFMAKKPREIKFRPLESERVMDGLQILSQHPAGRDYGHLLEGTDKFPVFVDAKGEILSMPPIINSHKTGRVNEKTKDVFIECSGFDYDILSKCLNIVVTSLADMGAEIYSMIIEQNGKKIESPNLNPFSAKLDIKYVNKMLGLNLTEKEIGVLLGEMGLGYKERKVYIPAYRTDILHQIDIVEDIAIAYGYENFEEEIPNVSTIGEEDGFEIFKNRVADILVGMGLIETISYNLSNEFVNDKKMKVESDCVKLANSLTVDYSCLRSWVLPSLMKILSENTSKEYPQNLFEMGTVFNKDEKQETGIKEEDGLCVVLCSSTSDFTKIRQVLDSVMKALDIDYEVKEASHPSFIEGRVGVLRVTSKTEDQDIQMEEDLAILGELNPEVIQNFNLEMPTAVFELNLSKLYGLMRK
ncbi:MAG: phenylalanine--tRNA ligase subunit beta [Nanoarchaeota archaeon]|nr:phenylalanine--tRNA ligase subunit beta [Nanoarchaeota archaeon]